MTIPWETSFQHFRLWVENGSPPSWTDSPDAQAGRPLSPRQWSWHCPIRHRRACGQPQRISLYIYIYLYISRQRSKRGIGRMARSRIYHIYMSRIYVHLYPQHSHAPLLAQPAHVHYAACPITGIGSESQSLLTQTCRPHSPLLSLPGTITQHSLTLVFPPSVLMHTACTTGRQSNL
jgi:hypothetical protein